MDKELRMRITNFNFNPDVVFASILDAASVDYVFIRVVIVWLQYKCKSKYYLFKIGVFF